MGTRCTATEVKVGSETDLSYPAPESFAHGTGHALEKDTMSNSESKIIFETEGIRDHLIVLTEIQTHYFSK
jgi:hypothetical protein